MIGFGVLIQNIPISADHFGYKTRIYMFPESDFTEINNKPL
jgi:hypothetical protein